MHDVELLKILAVGFALALGLGYLTHRLKMSPIVGYLLAGFLLGPYSPGFVADSHMAAQLAEVGVILLMFGVGLHFDLKDLLAVKGIAVPGAVGQSLVATALSAAIGHVFGLSLSAGLVLGLGVAVASTVVLMRVLVEHDLLDSVHGHVAVGWLIVEDIFTVLVLVLLPAIAMAVAGGTLTGAGLSVAVGVAVLKLAVLGVIILLLGGRLVPWVIALVARSRSRELFTLSILVMAIAVAVGSALLFGASMALGAFLAGMVVGRTPLSHQAAADVLPLRDAFAVLFFISVGMLFDPAFLVAHPLLTLALLGVILVVKPLVAGVIVLVLGYSMRTAMVVAVGLAQIGEFSFILAHQAKSLNLLPAEGASVMVACAMISIALNPLLFKTITPLEGWLRRRPLLWRVLNARSERKGRQLNEHVRAGAAAMPAAPEPPQAIVVGYGPVGRKVSELLRQYQVPSTIIELNVDTVGELTAQGHRAIFGNGAQPDILAHAGVARAAYLFITLPDLEATIGVITSARRLNPALKILVRARFLAAREILEGLGVTAVCFEEEEVARAMTQTLLAKVPAFAAENGR